MAGLTPIPLARFRDAIGTRGLNMSTFAGSLGLGRCIVSQVLNGLRPGGDTWPLIRAGVTDDEWAILLQMEHCATWNTAQCALGEEELVWKMRNACGWCDRTEGFKACNRAMAGKVTHGLCPECYIPMKAEIDRLCPVGKAA